MIETVATAYAKETANAMREVYFRYGISSSSSSSGVGCDDDDGCDGIDGGRGYGGGGGKKHSQNMASENRFLSTYTKVVHTRAHVKSF